MADDAIGSGVPFVDQSDGHADQENDCINGVVEDEVRGAAERHYDVVHQDLDDEAIHHAARDGVAAQRRDRTGDENEERGPAGRDEEVEREAESGCGPASAIGGLAEESGSD